MRTGILVLAAAAALTGVGCGATRPTTAQPTPAFPALTSAVATFVSTEHGKDAHSALTVQLLRNNAELVGTLQSVGTEFDDNSSSGPLAFAVTGPFTPRDIDSGQVRVRFVPDGRDDWTFDLHLTLQFGAGASYDFLWRGVRLDQSAPERMLALAPARR